MAKARELWPIGRSMFDAFIPNKTKKKPQAVSSLGRGVCENYI
jgi:hypothetical protein